MLSFIWGVILASQGLWYAIGIVALFWILPALWRKLTNPMVELNVNEPEGREAFRAVYVLAYQMIHADGREEKSELEMVISLIRDLLGDQEMDENFILYEYHLYGQHTTLDRGWHNLSLSYRRTLFYCAIKIAGSDKRITSEEISKLHDFACGLDLSNDDIRQKLKEAELDEKKIEQIFKTMYREYQEEAGGKQPESMKEWACKTLKISADATQEQIKAAYKKEAFASHPDRAKPKDKEAATARFKEIQEAYSILRKRKSPEGKQRSNG